MLVRTGRAVLGGVASVTFLPSLDILNFPGLKMGVRKSDGQKGFKNVSTEISKVKHFSVCSFDREE